MKMVSGEIEVGSPVVVYDYATSADHVVGDIPIGQALAALGEGVGSILPSARERAAAVPASWLEQDLSAASDLQRTFLPEPLAKNSANVKIVTEYMPAHAVGGDFYDFFDLGNGRLFGVIG